MNTRTGFTLVELMIVLVIVGVLTALAVPKFVVAADRTKEKEAELVLKQIYKLQHGYWVKNNSYATTVAELATVGFQEPGGGTMQHYEWDGDNSVDDGACLVKKPASAGHNSKSIDFTTGVISNC